MVTKQFNVHPFAGICPLAKMFFHIPQSFPSHFKVFIKLLIFYSFIKCSNLLLFYWTRSDYSSISNCINLTSSNLPIFFSYNMSLGLSYLFRLERSDLLRYILFHQNIQFFLDSCYISKAIVYNGCTVFECQTFSSERGFLVF